MGQLILLGLEAGGIFSWGGVLEQSFLECPSLLFLLLFKLLDDSMGVSLEESLVGVFCLFSFFVHVGSLGTRDADLFRSRSRQIFGRRRFR